ncbi:hypothetical protein VP01_3338g2 [Puccinia sorghi]|uniref:Uncharacterized protein n=1 Tax=Puccinia sorghi TaxID=27349 RepID=A0A0L6UXZ9_9BASI|nr:hypothetical protein VP01_3338g2 [Puccinia sorghi]
MLCLTPYSFCTRAATFSSNIGCNDDTKLQKRCFWIFNEEICKGKGTEMAKKGRINNPEVQAGIFLGALYTSRLDVKLRGSKTSHSTFLMLTVPKFPFLFSFTKNNSLYSQFLDSEILYKKTRAERQEIYLEIFSRTLETTEEEDKELIVKKRGNRPYRYRNGTMREHRKRTERRSERRLVLSKAGQCSWFCFSPSQCGSRVSREPQNLSAREGTKMCLSLRRIIESMRFPPQFGEFKIACFFQCVHNHVSRRYQIFYFFRQPLIINVKHGWIKIFFPKFFKEEFDPFIFLNTIHSVDDRAILCCLFLFHAIEHCFQKKIDPLLDRRCGKKNCLSR